MAYRAISATVSPLFLVRAIRGLLHRVSRNWVKFSTRERILSTITIFLCPYICTNINKTMKNYSLIEVSNEIRIRNENFLIYTFTCNKKMIRAINQFE